MTLRSIGGRLLDRVLKPLGLEVRLGPSVQRRLAWLRALGIDTVLDVGANTGAFAALLREALPNAQIYSFEPLPRCFAALVTSMGDDRRFQAFNVALGDEEGRMPFYENRWSDSSSLLPMTDLHTRVFPHTADHALTEVAVRRLDDVAAAIALGSHVLVKIDVQGGERGVLHGGDATVRAADVLLIEASFRELYEGQMLFDELATHLRDRGFLYMGALSPAVNDPKDGSNLFEDAIFVRRDVVG